LISIEHHPDDSSAEGDAGGYAVVQLAHFSVKEFLLSPELHKTRNHLAPRFAKAEVAKVLLVYLINLNHDLTPAQIVQEFPLSVFAACHWPSFCVEAGPDDDLLNHFTIQIMEYGSDRYRTWLCLYDPERNRIEKPWTDRIACRKRTEISPLYFAALIGLMPALQHLLQIGADVTARGGIYGNALKAASAGGHTEIVQLLLIKGAEVNAQGDTYGNALYAASFRGHVETVQLLLDKGAEVNAQGDTYGNALYAASFRGHVETVQLLLDKGAEVNAQGGAYGNALQAASLGGHIEIVQLLLDKGAEVNAEGGLCGTALQAALVGGYKEIVQLLLNRGARADA
jgi:hypothetical protein